MLDPNDPRAIAISMGLPPNLAAYMPRYIHVESGGNPNAQTGKYTGVLQMGPDERQQYGGNGVQQGVQMYVDRAKQFAAANNGRMPDPTELYLMNQQGPGGLANHMKNPGGAAWQNMYATAEGQQKGPEWAKKAIIWNIPNDQRAQYGMVPGNDPQATAHNMQFVDRVSSNNFMDGWRAKIEHTAVPPRPPADVPNAPPSGAPAPTQQQAFNAAPTAQQKTPLGNTLASAAAAPEIPTKVMPGPKSVFYDQTTPPVVGTGAGTVPLPQGRPYGAGPAVPANQKPATPAAAPTARGAPTAAAPAKAAAPGLGDRLANSYVDPTTGHTIVNPSGSGEQAMGITRDIGPAAARSAPAQAKAALPPGRGAPSGPVPRAPEAAGDLAAPDKLGPPSQTLDALKASQQKPNTLTSLYGSQTTPVNPPKGATLQDIASAPPATGFGAPKGSTLTDLPLPPYNVGGPSGTPLPPPRPNIGPDSGAPVARNFLRPGPAATPAEQAMQDAARATEGRYAAAQPPGPVTAGPPPAPPPPAGPGLGDKLSSAVKQFSGAPYSPGFLDPAAPAATPQEQVMRGQGQAATTGLPFVDPPPTPAAQIPPSQPSMPPGPQPQSMLPPWQQQQQLPLSPFNTAGLPGQGWPDWQNANVGFSGGNMGDFGGFSGGGGGEGFAFTPG